MEKFIPTSHYKQSNSGELKHKCKDNIKLDDILKTSR